MTKKKECGCGESTPQQACGSGQNQAPEHFDQWLEDQQLQECLQKIRHKVLVMSGKGGVGKSTVAANMAISLSLSGKRVGLLDVDIHGPSIPGMLHLEKAEIQMKNGMIQPVEHAGLKVMSVGFLLKNRDDAVIWRGPMKASVIKQFLKDVEWGELDYLIIDSPPGTGDEPLSVVQLAEPVDGAVVVTTPQAVATADVRKSIKFCKQLNLPVLGVVENMSGFVCPKCGDVTDIFTTGGGERMAAEMAVPFLGRIPIDPAVGLACDAGTPFVYHYSKTETAKAFERVIAPILSLSVKKEIPLQPQNKETMMKIAIPIAEGKLAMHFGHCAEFAFVDVDLTKKAITRQQRHTPPPHEPGVLPRWLHEQGVQVILAGGMGSRAQALFAENGIKVMIGAASESPEVLVAAYLAGTLQTGANVCDH